MQKNFDIKIVLKINIKPEMGIYIQVADAGGGSKIQIYDCKSLYIVISINNVFCFIEKTWTFWT